MLCWLMLNGTGAGGGAKRFSRYIFEEWMVGLGNVGWLLVLAYLYKPGIWSYLKGFFCAIELRESCWCVRCVYVRTCVINAVAAACVRDPAAAAAFWCVFESRAHIHLDCYSSTTKLTPKLVIVCYLHVECCDCCLSLIFLCVYVSVCLSA